MQVVGVITVHVDGNFDKFFKRGVAVVLSMEGGNCSD